MALEMQTPLALISADEYVKLYNSNNPMLRVPSSCKKCKAMETAVKKVGTVTMQQKVFPSHGYAVALFSMQGGGVLFEAMCASTYNDSRPPFKKKTMTRISKPTIGRGLA
jgi:hypothetical protein